MFFDKKHYDVGLLVIKFTLMDGTEKTLRFRGNCYRSGDSVAVKHASESIDSYMEERVWLRDQNGIRHNSKFVVSWYIEKTEEYWVDKDDNKKP